MATEDACGYSHPHPGGRSVRRSVSGGGADCRADRNSNFDAGSQPNTCTPYHSDTGAASATCPKEAHLQGAAHRNRHRVTETHGSP